MATQIVISNNDYIKVDDSFHIEWADKGNAWQDAWCPNTIHAVVWNNLTGQNEIQNKDASTDLQQLLICLHGQKQEKVKLQQLWLILKLQLLMI